jgi:hypothetical protein
MAIDRESTEKMEARAKRFQLENAGHVNYDDVQKLYDVLNIPADQRGGDNVEDRSYRLEAVHLTGFDSTVQKEDLFNYFAEFSPVALEWVNAKSANILWAIEISAAKALCSLSRPIANQDDDELMVIDAAASNGAAETDGQSDDPAKNREKLLAKFEGRLGKYSSYF